MSRHGGHFHIRRGRCGCGGRSGYRGYHAFRIHVVLAARGGSRFRVGEASRPNREGARDLRGQNRLSRACASSASHGSPRDCGGQHDHASHVDNEAVRRGDEADRPLDHGKRLRAGHRRNQDRRLDRECEGRHARRAHSVRVSAGQSRERHRGVSVAAAPAPRPVRRSAHRRGRQHGRHHRPRGQHHLRHLLDPRLAGLSAAGAHRAGHAAAGDGVQRRELRRRGGGASGQRRVVRVHAVPHGGHGSGRRRGGEGRVDVRQRAHGAVLRAYGGVSRGSLQGRERGRGGELYQRTRVVRGVQRARGGGEEGGE